MNGLELSEAYYHSCGEAMLQQFPALANRVATGLAGPGSECFGLDDEISRDHDWGPSFCLWLDADDFRRFGPALQQAYTALPRTFMGFGPRRASPGEEGRVGVINLVDFFQAYTGMTRPPTAPAEWLKIPEENLALCTNGKVFHDPLGTVTAWREHLDGYFPEDVRLKKLTSRSFTAGQAGQYNLPRAVQRNDLFSANYSLIKFCSDILLIVYLLNRTYAPYFKLLHRGVKRLPILGAEVHRAVAILMNEGELTNELKVERVEALSRLLIKTLRELDLTSCTSDFLLDHAASVNTRISDRQLRIRLPQEG